MICAKYFASQSYIYYKHIMGIVRGVINMAALIDLEKKVWQLQFRDGTWEIMFGMMLVIGAIRTLTDNVYFTLIIIAGIIVFAICKLTVTRQRLGKVRYRKERMKRQQWAGLIFAGLLVGTMALFTLSVTGIVLADFSDVIVVVFIIVVFAAVAYYFDYWRFVIIGIVFGVKEIIWQVFEGNYASYFAIVAGSIMLTAGIWQFLRFLRKYPKSSKEVPDACQ